MVKIGLIVEISAILLLKHLSLLPDHIYLIYHTLKIQDVFLLIIF